MLIWFRKVGLRVEHLQELINSIQVLQTSIESSLMKQKFQSKWLIKLSRSGVREEYSTLEEPSAWRFRSWVLYDNDNNTFYRKVIAFIHNTITLR
ncbi:hypothetical protein QQ045_027742 [Rhodiola kirilowii]